MLRWLQSQGLASVANNDAPEEELSLELLLSSLELDESSDDEDESSLLLESESSEDNAGFFRFFLSSLADDSLSLPLLASPGSSSEAPKKRGLYCMKAAHVSTYKYCACLSENKPSAIQNECLTHAKLLVCSTCQNWQSQGRTHIWVHQLFCPGGSALID